MVSGVSFYRELEDLSHEHMRVIKRLDKYVEALESAPVEDEGLQVKVLTCLRRLRAIRSKLLGMIGEGVSMDDASREVREGISILSEYMVLGGLYLERDLLERIRELKGRFTILAGSAGDIERDLRELDRLSELLEGFVDEQEA
ncbi:MAG: hypothetical protein GXO09_05720 [Crenarchaeota archaeon]|nr:hypothetical protein [Thermoproteota archaeon]